MNSKLSPLMSLILVLMPITACAQVRKTVAVHHKSAEDTYIDAQLKIIDQHKKQLVAAGRITDPDHFSSESYLATYGWHSSCDVRTSLPGTNGENARWLAISTGCEGSFGAYTFSEEAFKQAQRLYVVHGEMLAGSDILIDATWGECIPEKGGGCVVGSSDGYTSPRAKGAFDANVIGYSVGSLTYCMKYGAHYEHCDGKDFTEPSKVVKFIDGGHIQLNHKVKYDAEMYGLIIAPPDYVDMCQCTTPMTTVTEDESKKTKACVQGGSLAPGESCAISIGIQ